MRRKVCALMMIPALLLTGCGKKSDGERAEELLTEVRGEYLEAAVCTGQAAITADYGQRVYTYDLTFSWQREGETVLTITSPENVAGTVARITEGETVLEYDGVMVETGPLDADGLTPMGAVPALLACVREGYLAECNLEDWDEKSVFISPAGKQKSLRDREWRRSFGLMRSPICFSEGRSARTEQPFCNVILPVLPCKKKYRNN